MAATLKDSSKDDVELPYKVGIATPQTIEKRTTSDVFFLLWKRKFESLDLSIVDAEKIPTNAVNNWNAYHYDKKSKRHVVLNNRAIDDKDTSYMAVFDTLDPNRAFIGQVVVDNWGDSSHSTTTTLIGGIGYFDSQGKLEGPITSFSRRVFEVGGFDNSNPCWDNVILCGEILVFAKVWSRMFRGTSLSIGGWVMRNDSLDNQFGWLKITTADGTEVTDWRPDIVGGRWLCLEDDARKNTVCVDLKSFRSRECEKQEDPDTYETCDRQSLYDRVVLPSGADLAAYLESLTDKLPEYKQVTEDNDGYPVSCPRCSKATVSATTLLNDGDGSGKTMSFFFGRGVCLHCTIRFSASEKTWKCLHFQEDDVKLHCNATVEAESGYVCTLMHDNPDAFVETRKEKPRRNRSIKLEVELQLKRKANAISKGADEDDGMAHG
jgi:hypothetical protein